MLSFTFHRFAHSVIRDTSILSNPCQGLDDEGGNKNEREMEKRKRDMRASPANTGRSTPSFFQHVSVNLVGMAPPITNRRVTIPTILRKRDVKTCHKRANFFSSQFSVN